MRSGTKQLISGLRKRSKLMQSGKGSSSLLNRQTQAMTLRRYRRKHGSNTVRKMLKG